MKQKAIVEIYVGDDPTKCDDQCYCAFGSHPRYFKGIATRYPYCLAATKLAERIINELNRLRDLAGENEHKSIGELLAELEVSDDTD